MWQGLGICFLFGHRLHLDQAILGIGINGMKVTRQ
jgi:hypothetical protein